MKSLRKTFILALSLFVCTSEKIFCSQLEFETAGFGSSVLKSKVQAEWNEDFFTKHDSSTYNHKLARIACIFSELSYVDVKDSGQSNELLWAYEKIGMQAQDIDFHYDVDYTDSAWGWNQCAFSIGSKKIQTEKGSEHLVFIVMRGTPLNADEWISNINVNDLTKKASSLHQGFSVASEQVYNNLIEYLYRHKIDREKVYLLITGHSRGAAVANILSAKLADSNLIEKNKIFTYTFASPNVTIEEVGGKYDFIFNIINAEDIVPTVPFNNSQQWQYKKFGKSLVLVNAWNCDPTKYDTEYLPKMNAYFYKFMGRNYKPFRTGPFIPVQVTNILTNLNSSVEYYYNGTYALHAKFTDLLKKIFPDTKDLLPDEKTEGSGSVPLSIIKWLNNRTNGLADYATDACNDMHACESYLSWMLALEEKELFSTLGYKQIVIKGHEDISVMSSDKEILAKARDGMILYSSNHLPVAACSLPGKIVIGLPANQSFTLTIGNESLAPSSALVLVDKYGPDGVRESSEKEIRISPRQGKSYFLKGGKDNYWQEATPITCLNGKEGRELYKSAGLEDDRHIKFAPEVSFDTDERFCVGARLLYKNIFISLLTDFNLSKDTSFSLNGGLGKRGNLVAGLYADFDLFAKCFWNLSEKEKDDQEVFNLVPSLRLSLSVQPIHRFQIFVASVIDMNIKDFNDGAFSNNVRKRNLPAIDLGDQVKLISSIQFGLRF